MSRADFLAALRADRHEEKRSELLTERVECEQRYRDAQQRASDLVALNDLESAKWYDAQLEEIEREVAQIDQQLDGFDHAQRPQGLSEAKQEWIARRQDLAAMPGASEVANAAHNHIVGTMGVTDDSPEYFELMGHALEPPSYEPMPTADDIAEACGIDADTYNRGVEKLWRLKAAGQYIDK